jgi:hypothetical protein
MARSGVWAVENRKGGPGPGQTREAQKNTWRLVRLICFIPPMKKQPLAAEDQGHADQ